MNNINKYWASCIIAKKITFSILPLLITACTFPDNSTGIFSEWIPYDIFAKFTGVSWIRCANTNQYLSGLAFVWDVAHNVYHWWGRCSNISAIYMKREGFCWMSSGTSLVQGSNGSVSVPADTIVMDSVRIEYPDYATDAFYNTQWSYRFCLVIDGIVLLCK